MRVERRERSRVSPSREERAEPPEAGRMEAGAGAGAGEKEGESRAGAGPAGAGWEKED